MPVQPCCPCCAPCARQQTQRTPFLQLRFLQAARLRVLRTTPAAAPAATKAPCPRVACAQHCRQRRRRHVRARAPPCKVALQEVVVGTGLGVQRWQCTGACNQHAYGSYGIHACSSAQQRSSSEATRRRVQACAASSTPQPRLQQPRLQQLPTPAAARSSGRAQKRRAAPAWATQKQRAARRRAGGARRRRRCGGATRRRSCRVSGGRLAACRLGFVP